MHSFDPEHHNDAARGELLTLLALGEPIERQHEAHIQGCVDCQNELAALRRTVTRARYLGIDEDQSLLAPSPAVWQNIVAELDLDTQGYLAGRNVDTGSTTITASAALAQMPGGPTGVQGVARPGSSTVVIGPVTVDLKAGTETIVYAIGSAEKKDLALVVQTITGMGGAPGGVNAGTGGFAAPTDPGTPAWVWALAGVGGLAGTQRRNRRWSPDDASSPPAEPNSPPTTLQISSLKINASVVSVGVDAAGDMQIPDDVQTTGWYQFGPAPGSSTGSVVVVGHVDSAEQGSGTFSTLKSITAGAAIVLTTADSQQRQYKVVGVQAYPKSAVPLSDLFSTVGAPRLTLITCGGLFDNATHSHESNVVVTATPS